MLALTVVAVFALADADPVLKLFTWLTNLGALGVLLLMAVTSFAVVAYFRRRPDTGVSPWAGTIAPAIAGVALLVVLVLGVLNFNVLITGATDAPTDTMAIVLPVILFGAGLLGLVDRHVDEVEPARRLRADRRGRRRGDVTSRQIPGQGRAAPASTLPGM